MSSSGNLHQTPGTPGADATASAGQQSCEHCGQPSQASVFCSYCNHLQRPTPDYYRFLGLERKLNLDLEDLRQRFYSISRRLHPDRFLRASPAEQQYSLEGTAILNDAYRVLRDPIARAEYVLKDEGVLAGEQNSRKASPELLEEMFELNLAVEEARSGNPDGRAMLEYSRERLAKLRGNADTELARLFEEYDHSRDSAVLARIRGVLDRRRYVRNLEEQVERELADVRTLPD